MEVYKKINELKIALKRKEGIVGFVPTMGALHNGHLSLIQAAREDADTVVVSIFVNPLQFAPDEDYKKYPRTIDNDIILAEECGVDVVFAPIADEIYPNVGDRISNINQLVIDVGEFGNILCGKYRKGHFNGVVTVVAKLFNIVQPDVAYFGQKDYQQAVIIKKMVKDLNFPVEVKVLPTVREADGLAMSSRNSYLPSDERKSAALLYKSLLKAEELIKSGEKDVKKIIKESEKIFNDKPLCKLQYFEIVDHRTLQPIRRIDGILVALVAAFIGNIRLIDNIIIES